MITNGNIKYWRFTIVGICVAVFALFLWALCNLPSKNMYNPHQADERQYGAQSYTMPPPCVDAETKTHCEHTTSDVEQYTADRSALAAQWASADVTHLAYYAGLLGISLIILTFFETYVAGREMRKQNAMGQLGMQLEYSPYIEVGDMHLFGRPDAINVHDDGFVTLQAYIMVKNKGKTTMYTRRVDASFALYIVGYDKELSVPLRGGIQDYEIIPGGEKKLSVILNGRLHKKFSGTKIDFNDAIFTVKTVIEFDDIFSIKLPTPYYRRTVLMHRGKFFLANRDDGVTSYALEFGSINNLLRPEDIHESKRVENRPKRKTLAEFLSGGKRSESK